MAGIKSKWVSDGIKAKSKGHAVFRATVNNKPGQCERCKGLGKIIWNDSQKISICYSCQGRGIQSENDLVRNTEFNQKLDAKIQRKGKSDHSNLAKSSKREISDGMETEYSRSFILNHADRLRRNQTQSERRLASILDVLEGGKWKGHYKAQHAFSGRWIADFYIPSIRLVIEVDGPSHNAIPQKEKDARKANEALDLSLSIVRFTNEEVWNNSLSFRKRLLASFDEAEFRTRSSLGPLGLPFSTTLKSRNKRHRWTVRNSKGEWKDLPDYAPRLPTPDESLSEKYLTMTFSDALAIPRIKLIRQCLNYKCNHESVLDLKTALEEKIVSPNCTCAQLEARSICSSCNCKFVLVRLGELALKS